MTKVTLYKPDKIADGELKFAVIAARYQEKWVFCRHKQRTTWEIPGGHREPGELIEETARRELAEETGAVDIDIRTVAAYGVEKDGKQSYGMLFFVNINSIDALSDTSEIGEIRLFDVLPENLTYPEIQPHLYHGTQVWLNVQSNAGEMRDIYDENRNLTGGLQRKGDFLEDDE